jgi:hypothetical protein
VIESIKRSTGWRMADPYLAMAIVTPWFTLLSCQVAKTKRDGQ